MPPTSEDTTALTTRPTSTNGLTEYTASNFQGGLSNNLIAAGFNGNIFRVQLNNQGNIVTSNSILMPNVGQTPLDVTAMGDNEAFPGTIWVADLFGDEIYIMEPEDF